MQSRKEELTESLISYLLANGLTDLSLRPLAAGAGTSARLLIYHYGSKEGLLAEVLEAMQAKVRESFALLVQKATKGTTPPLRLFWNWAISKENFPYLKLLYELQVLAVQNPGTYAQYLEHNTDRWLELALTALSLQDRNPAFATLCTAVFDGLFMEFMSTGDQKRTTQALDHFIHLVGDARARRSEG